jgi:CDP-diacylglycerol---glycerol-3-phosphate 3-phosphatidyltransferase
VVDIKRTYSEGARRGFYKVGVMLARLHVTADMLTIVGLLLQVAAVPLVLTGHFAWVALIITVAAICDALDGAVARAGTGPTKAGAFLDSTTDRISELIVSSALVFYMARQERWYECVAVLVAMGSAQLVSYTRARAEALGVSCSVGLMSRPERIFVMAVGFLFAGWHVGDVSVLTMAIYLLAVLTPLTVLRRMVHTMRKLRSAGEGTSELV